MPSRVRRGSAPVSSAPPAPASARRTVDLGFTTPEAPDLQALLATMRDEGVRTVAMEVSSHALDQHRVDGTRFAAACFTNLSHDHLDYHHTVEAYFAAKARLFTPERCAVAVTNLDDVHGREIARLAAAAGLPVVTYARDDASADFGVDAVGYGATGTDLVLVDRRAGEQAATTLALLGPVNVWNALAATATARALDEPLATVARGLAAVGVVPGRLERIDAGQPFTVLVDYAHTPDALVHAVAAARVLAGDHRVAVVFGCGGDRDADKRAPMGAAAAAADHVIVTTDNPRSEDPALIAAAAASGVRAVGGTPLVELDRRAAIAAAVRWAGAGDVVLVAGKGHESGQTAAGVTVAFDDRVVVRELLEARRTVTVTAAQLAAAVDGVIVGDPDARATSYAIDSRVLEPGACFVALRGERDGHDFVADAFARGARIALVSRVVDPPPPGTALVRRRRPARRARPRRGPRPPRVAGRHRRRHHRQRREDLHQGPDRGRVRWRSARPRELRLVQQRGRAPADPPRRAAGHRGGGGRDGRALPGQHRRPLRRGEPDRRCRHPHRPRPRRAPGWPRRHRRDQG